MGSTTSNSSARATEILEEIQRTAPVGCRANAATYRELRALSAALVAVSGDSVAEFHRYLAITERGIAVPHKPVLDAVAGRTVLVTGAAGCIGTALLRQLSWFQPGRIVSVDVAEPVVPVAEHHPVDVRDEDAVTRLAVRVRPDIVFHLAAQRDPGLAEHAVHRTVTTNVIGTRNVVAACARANVGRLVFASTGKALRPYTTDVYAASKRAAELVVADAGARGLFLASAVRFTHVVDNSIVLERFRTRGRRGKVLRLHSPHDMFYAQSALESAQLLLVAAMSPAGAGLHLHAIRDLGLPFTPLDVALGVLAEQGTAPLRVTGHDPGYEAQSFPGLYDPAIAGEVSPLINSFEAPRAEACPSADVDRVPVRFVLHREVHERLDELTELCALTREPETVRCAFDGLSRSLLENTLANVPTGIARRVADLTRPHAARLNDTNRFIYQHLRRRAEQGDRHRAGWPTGAQKAVAGW